MENEVLLRTSGGESNQSSRSGINIMPSPRKIVSSRSLLGPKDHSKASLLALAHLITKSTIKASTVVENVLDDSVSGETVINIIEPDYTESYYEMPFEEMSKLEVFFEESIREILITSTEELGEHLVREFLSNFLDEREENEAEVTKLCKRLLGLPHLWEESEYVKFARQALLNPDFVSDITSQALGEVLEETIKETTTRTLGEQEISSVRRELRKLYYTKACQITKADPNPIILDALDDFKAEKGVINVRGRGGINGKMLNDHDLFAFTVCVKCGLRVTSLNLSNNEITDFGLWHLSHLLRNMKLPNLLYLDISQNNITDRGISIFADCFKGHPILSAINLKGNKINGYGGLCLVSALSHNDVLTTLDLTSTDLEMQTLVALLVVISEHPSLTSVKIGRPLIFSQQEEPLIHLRRVFEMNSVLRKVSVPKFSITDAGVAIIVPGLIQNHTLVHLDLSCNRIVWDGAKLLSEYLKSNTSIQVLILNANRIEDVGAKYIAKALANYKTTLRKLSLTNNNIGIRGLCSLAAGINKNARLNYLKVWGNKMEGDACLALSHLLTTKRLKPNCVDFIPYTTVDGIISLAHNYIN